MNEQRKVIYRRRQQVLDGEDLRDAALEAIERAIGRQVDLHCAGEFAEEWNTEELLTAVKTYFPTRVTKEQLDDAPSVDAAEELLYDDAIALYEEKEAHIGDETLRDIERRVMLSVLDQHWREHLYEMDYLQEGINLRAMGQRDPLAEWQREGFDMFEAMMGQIEDDFVRYVFHLQVVVDEQPAPQLRNVQYTRGRGAGPGRGRAAHGRRRRRRRHRRAGAGAGRHGHDRPRRRRPRRRRRTEHAGPGREDARPQRAVFLRERQEVQDVPRALTRPPDSHRCATSPRTLPSCARRVRDAHEYLRIDDAREAAGRARRGGGRSRAVERPGAGAQGHDRAVARARRRRARRRRSTSASPMPRRCSSSDAKRATTRSRARSPTAIAKVSSELDRLELRALFSGEHDERDAICEIHSGAGGTDAQDWAEMLLRMYTRWAQDRGFEFEVDEVQEGQEAGHHVRDLHRQGPLRVRHCSPASAACTG